MNKTWMIIAILCLLSGISKGLEVPVSSVPVLSDANLLTGLSRVIPDDQAAEKLQTKSWLWQDGEDLIVYMECELDSLFKVGTISPRDGSPDADYLRVQLITVPEAYYAYYYYAYPLGNLRDGVRSSTSADQLWNSHYSYQTEYDSKQWRVTFCIPLGELRFQQKLPYQWKIILTRGLAEASETYSLPYVTTQMQNDYYVKAQDITLSGKVKRKLDLKLMPYFVKSYDLISKTSSFDPDNIGLDLAFNPSQRIRIKATLNPDYSDVPPDNAADNYNSKFPPYFSENRFFFTEDIDALGVNMNTFYTRKIVQPSLAFKVTGTTGKLNWGALGAKDQKISLGPMLINRDDYYQVLALIPGWKNLKLSNAIVTRTNKDYYNHVYRGSYRWNFAKDFLVTAGLNASLKKDERQGASEQEEGLLGSIQLNAFPGDWSGSLSYARCSDDFYADAGYFWYNNFQSLDSYLSWDSQESKNYIKNHGASVSYSSKEYLDSKKWESSASASYYAYFRPEFNLYFGSYIGKELDDLDAVHDVYELEASAGFTRWDAFQLSFGVERGHSLVYDLFQTYNFNSLEGTIYGNIGQSFSYNLTAELKDHDYPRVSTVVIDTTNTIVELDDRYTILNSSLAYNPSGKLRLSSGVGISSYEEAGVFASLSYYASLRYEFRPEYFLYMGYTTGRSQTEKSSYNYPLGGFQNNSASLYAKLAITL